MIDVAYLMTTLGYIDEEGGELQQWFSLLDSIDHTSRGQLLLRIKLTPVYSTRLQESTKLSLRFNHASNISNWTVPNTKHLFHSHTNRQRMYAQVSIGGVDSQSTLSAVVSARGQVCIHDVLYFDIPKDVLARKDPQVVVKVLNKQDDSQFGSFKFSLDQVADMER